MVGGSEGINYYISFGHYDTEGIMDDSSLRRETLRSNVEVKVTGWLKAGINVNLSYQKYNTTTFGTEANSVYNKAYAARIYRPDQTINEILTDEEGNFTGYGKRLDYLTIWDIIIRITWQNFNRMTGVRYVSMAIPSLI